MDNSAFAVDSTFGIWFAIFVIGNFALVTLIFVAYDSILRLEYASYRITWESDGQPLGFFWIAPEERRLVISPFAHLKKQFARNRLSPQWLFSTPEWMINDARVLQLVSKYRRLTMIWTIFGGFPTLIILIILF